MLPNKKSLLLTMFIVSLFPLTGCWDSEEIDDRAVILAISIDEAKGKNPSAQIAYSGKYFQKPNRPLIELKAQIAVPGRIPLGPQTGGGTGGEKPPVWVVGVRGHTIDEAMLNLQQRVPDPLFMGHLRTIVISECIAKQGVNRFVDFFKRNSQVRRTAWMVVSKGRADKFMYMAPQLERVPGLYLATVMDQSVSLGKFPNDAIGLFWSILSSHSQDTYLPYLDIKNKENVELKGLAYFNDDRMAGTINPLEMGPFMGIIGVKKGGYGTFVKIPEIEGSILVKASKRNARVKTSFLNGRPHVRIKYHYEIDIDERREALDPRTLNPRNIKEIERKFNKGIEETTKQMIAKTQKKHSDIFGFGNHFRAKQHRYWKTKVGSLQKWHQEYEKLTVEVICESNVRRVGMKSR